MKSFSQTKINFLFFIGSLALLLFTLESVTIAQDIHRVGNFDYFLAHAIQSRISPITTALMSAATQLASPLMIVLLTLLVIIALVIGHYHVTGLWFGVTLAFSTGLLNPLLKQLIGRPRPVFNRLISESGYSFPSGHAIAATVFYGMIAMMASIYLHKTYQKVLIGLAVICTILLIMYSRIYLGVHYPTDVIGGGLLGTAVVCLSTGFFLIYGPGFHQRLNSRGWHDQSLETGGSHGNLNA